MNDHFWSNGKTHDLLLDGFGTGSFLFAVLLSFLHKDDLKSASMIAAIIIRAGNAGHCETAVSC